MRNERTEMTMEMCMCCMRMSWCARRAMGFPV